MPPLRATRPTRRRMLWLPRYHPLGSVYIGPFQGGGPFEASRACGGSSAQAKTDSILTKGAVTAAAASMHMTTPGEPPIPPPPSGRPRSFGWLQGSSRSQSRRGKQQQVFPRRNHHRRATHSTASLAVPDRSGGFKGPRAPRADEGNSKCSLEGTTPGEPPIPPPVWPDQIVLVDSRVLALPEPTRERTASVPSKGPPPASHPSHHYRLAGQDCSSGFKGPRAPRADEGNNSKCSLEGTTPGEPPIPPPPSGRPRSFGWLQGSSRSQSRRGKQQQVFPRRDHTRRATHSTASLAVPDRSGGFKGPRAPRADEGKNSKCSLEGPTTGEPPIPPLPSGRPRLFEWLQGTSRSQSRRGKQQQVFPRRDHTRRATHPPPPVWPYQIVRVASRDLALPEPTRERTASVPSKGPPPASHPSHHYRLAGQDCSSGFKGPRAPRADEGNNSKCSLEGTTPGEPPIPPPPSGRPRSFWWIQGSSRSQSRRGKEQQVFPRRAHHRRATHPTTTVWPAKIVRVASRDLALPEPTRETTASVPSKGPHPASHPSHHHHLAGPDRSSGFKGPRAPRADEGNNSKCSLEGTTPGEPPIPPPPSGRPRLFGWLQGTSRSQSRRGKQQQVFPRRANSRRATHPTTTIWPAQIVRVASRVLALPEPTRETTASVPSKGPHSGEPPIPPPPSGRPRSFGWLQGSSRSQSRRGKQQQVFPRRDHTRRATHPTTTIWPAQIVRVASRVPRAPRADEGNNSKCSLEGTTPGEPPIPPPPSGRPRSFGWLQGSSRSQSRRGKEQQVFPRRANSRRATHPTTTVWPAQIVRVASRVLALPEPTRETTASVPSKGPHPASHPSHHHRLDGPDRSGGFKGPGAPRADEGNNSKCSLEGTTPGEPPIPPPVWPDQIVRVDSRVLALPEPTRETSSFPSKGPLFGGLK
ncbi:proline-rich protein 36-like [Dermacentor silvarum]|uniref:proline-rich protein 36-like n=1 Tax=Dermacentor silvarum TaxID=543639 RepID=UPI00189B1E26|nr:proline-rich protein 36-like [Dermacentor silvarum]